jgi:hypothetical protein
LAKSSCHFGYNIKLAKKKNLGSEREKTERFLERLFDEGSHQM